MSKPSASELQSQRRAEILGGPLLPALIKLAWPTATTAALQGLIAAVDVVMVGQLGETAVASVTSSRQAVMVLQVAGGAMAMGAGTLVAQAIGRGDPRHADQVTTQALLVFALAMLFGVVPLGWFLSEPMMRWMNPGEAEVVALGVPYMRVVVASNLFTMLGFAASAALRGAGDTHTPLRIALLANVLHVPANYVCIFGLPAMGLPGLGVVGAAWGTAVVRTGTNLILLWWMLRGSLAVRLLGPRSWRLDLRLLVEMARIGIPASLSSIILNLNGLAVLGILARTDDGRMAVAAYGLGNTIRNFGTWMTWGLSDATSTMVGQNIGARQRRRARASGFVAAKVSSLFLLAAGLLMAAAAPLVFPAILREDDPLHEQQVIAIAVQYLVSQVFALPFLGVGMALEGALRGAGDTMAALANNALSFLLVGVPCCALLALEASHLGPLVVPGLGLGPVGVWLGVAASMVTRGVSMYLKWRRVRWPLRSAAVL
ncbi:MAG: MATE family efflux transporter [Armatimonadetes bacterium]|nr:MATE family efflux transporter [Armatimonadota bacterium]